MVKAPTWQPKTFRLERSMRVSLPLHHMHMLRTTQTQSSHQLLPAKRLKHWTDSMRLQANRMHIIYPRRRDRKPFLLPSILFKSSIAGH